MREFIEKRAEFLLGWVAGALSLGLLRNAYVAQTQGDSIECLLWLLVLGMGGALLVMWWAIADLLDIISRGDHETDEPDEWEHTALSEGETETMTSETRPSVQTVHAFGSGHDALCGLTAADEYPNELWMHTTLFDCTLCISLNTLDDAMDDVMEGNVDGEV